MLFRALSLLATLGTSAAEHDNVTLVVQSKNVSFNGLELLGLHFRKGVSGVILTSNDLKPYNYNSTSHEVWQPVETLGGAVDHTFREYQGDLILGTHGKTAKLNGEYMTINGSDSSFYACKELPYDPMSYVKHGEEYGVAIYSENPPAGCYPIKITFKERSSLGNQPISDLTAGHNSSTTTTSSNLGVAPRPASAFLVVVGAMALLL